MPRTSSWLLPPPRAPAVVPAPLRASLRGQKGWSPAKPPSPAGRVPPPTMAVSPQSHQAMLPSPVPHPQAWGGPSDSRGPSRAPQSVFLGPHQTHVHIRLGASAGRNRLPSARSQRPVWVFRDVCTMDM